MTIYLLTIQEVIGAVAQGYSWAIPLVISLTAAYLAVSLVAWLIHRS